MTWSGLFPQGVYAFSNCKTHYACKYSYTKAQTKWESEPRSYLQLRVET